MVFQDPLAALNPVRTVGFQIAEPLLAHLVSAARSARRAGSFSTGRLPSSRQPAAIPPRVSGGWATLANPEALAATEV